MDKFTKNFNGFLIIFFIINGLLLNSVWSVESSASKKQQESNGSISKQLIKISEAWARLPIGLSNNSAAYMKIYNITNDEITISLENSDIANRIELHNNIVDNAGVTKMIKVDLLTIPAFSDVELKPGGMHIMLLGIKKSLILGEVFDLKLKCKEKGNKKETIVTVPVIVK